MKFHLKIDMASAGNSCW